MTANMRADPVNFAPPVVVLIMIEIHVWWWLRGGGRGFRSRFRESLSLCIFLMSRPNILQSYEEVIRSLLPVLKLEVQNLQASSCCVTYDISVFAELSGGRSIYSKSHEAQGKCLFFSCSYAVIIKCISLSCLPLWAINRSSSFGEN